MARQPESRATEMLTPLDTGVLPWPIASSLGLSTMVGMFFICTAQWLQRAENMASVTEEVSLILFGLILN